MVVGKKLAYIFKLVKYVGISPSQPLGYNSMTYKVKGKIPLLSESNNWVLEKKLFRKFRWRVKS